MDHSPFNLWKWRFKKKLCSKFWSHQGNVILTFSFPMQPLNVTVQPTILPKILPSSTTRLLHATFECDRSTNNPAQSIDYIHNETSSCNLWMWPFNQQFCPKYWLHPQQDFVMQHSNVFSVNHAEILRSFHQSLFAIYWNWSDQWPEATRRIEKTLINMGFDVFGCLFIFP